MNCANATRISEGDGDTGKVGGGQLAVAGAGDNIFISGDELGEVHRFRLFNCGDHQGAAAVFAPQVDSQAQVNVVRLNTSEEAVLLL